MTLHFKTQIFHYYG